MRSLRLVGPVIAMLAVAPVRAHQGLPDEGDTSLIHACQRTSASGRVRMRFVSPTGTCPSNPAWQPVHWPAVPPSVAVRDISARVYNSTPISIPNDTTTPLSFDKERWDTENLHSTTTNPSRVTITTPGKYLLYGHIVWAANASGSRKIGIRINGLTVDEIANERVAASPGGVDATSQSIATHYQLSAGDYVELVAEQTSGGALDVIADNDTGGRRSPEFGVVKLP